MPSSHEFGALGAPGTPHSPPGHSEFTAQGWPALPPALQRLPPQMPGLPPEIGHVASLRQGSALALLQVSQKQL